MVAEQEIIRRLLSRPNRVAIIRLIGEKGEAGFKELKSKLNMGVGTLYYHLDALSEFVTQNSSRQYTLTGPGKQLYEALKDIELPADKLPARRIFLSFKDVIREILFLESHIERLSHEPLSNLSMVLGLVLLGSVLAGQLRLEPAIIFLRGRARQPALASVEFLFSWLAVFLISSFISIVIWKGRRNLLGIAAACALSFSPMLFFMLIDGLRRVFDIAQLATLYSSPTFFILQVVMVVWSSFILTISLRSAVGLTLEKALVVTLIILIVNLGYFWIRPVLIQR